MPRVRHIPVDPHHLQRWDGQSDLAKRHDGNEDDSGESSTRPPFKPTHPHPVVGNGSMVPTTDMEALMMAAPLQEPHPSSESMVDVAVAIQEAMENELTERERFVVEALVFEGLSLRELESRWNKAWGKTQIARIRDQAFAKMAKSEILRKAAGINECP